MIASEYDAGWVEAARGTVLYIATKLGDYVNDLVVVGGLVPSILIEPLDLPANHSLHPGTRDVDLALRLAILEKQWNSC